MPPAVHSKVLPGGKEITFQESLSEVMWAVFFYGIGYVFLLLAILHLALVRPVEPFGLLASLAWIAIMVLHFVFGCRRLGTRQHLGNVRSNFIRNRFAQFAPDASGEPMLCFGCQTGSTRHYFLKLRPKGIKSVDWGPGQANNPKRDNDWNVALWFDPASVVFDGSPPTGSGIHIVGSSGPKKERAAFGKEFIEFLQTNQIDLALPATTLLGQTAEVLASGRWGMNVTIRVGTDQYVAHSLQGTPKAESKAIIEEIRGTSIYIRPGT